MSYAALIEVDMPSGEFWDEIRTNQRVQPVREERDSCIAKLNTGEYFTVVKDDSNQTAVVVNLPYDGEDEELYLRRLTENALKVFEMIVSTTDADAEAGIPEFAELIAERKRPSLATL
ncbi:hypothetical protein [uncultured Brevibacterium sp.]|uniref:hypothetical protein n=1 Tax=uncultured Brevibacterium sp. TaxID=189678 RepID=UPI0025CD5977|nr:hypothetical protein [uncultured Brevibacterium sp.]